MALSLLAAVTQETTVTAYRAERRMLERVKLGAALDAGVVRAVMGIEAPDITDRWRVDGVAHDFDFRGTRLRIAIQDELGRFDLNSVDASMLRALLKSQNVPQAQIDILVDRILDWRSPSNLHRLHGATDADYAAAGLTYHPRHGPYQSVDELQLVLGMTKAVYTRICPALTVYTKNPMIDPNYAPREALLALYNGDEDAVDEMIRARSENPNTGTVDSAVSLAGQTFSISVGTYANGRMIDRHVVVMITTDPKRPYLTMAWK